VITISVALCTYQGGRFLPDQLRSIAEQQRLPDELVVCDDGSTDETLDQLEAFRASAPFPVRVHCNPERLGVTANFSRAIALSTGSVVALCDQDDVWMASKLARQAEVFESSANVGAVFGDAEVVDAALHPTGRSLFEATGFSPRRQRRFRRGGALDVMLARPVVCGATLAFRSYFRDLLLPIPSSGVHDVWLATLLAAVTETIPLSDTLIRYRQHGSNEIGAPTRSLRRKQSRRRMKGVFGDEVAHYRAIAERLAAAGPKSIPEWRQPADAIGRKVQHLQFRYRAPPPGPGSILLELARGRYHRYSRGAQSAAFDLFFRPS
jgi:glycosyltransferase involved in cell wall biosynthesis